MIVAGGGPGAKEYLSYQVIEAIKEADKVVAFRRLGQGLKSLREDIILIDKVSEILDYKDEDGVLLLASGDPNFYGIVSYLIRSGIRVDKVLPGLSSFQYLSCKLMKSWEKANLLSLHGREDDLASALENKLTIILLDSKNRPGLVSKKLKELGLLGKITVGFNLSYPDERIIEVNVGDEIEDISPLAIMVVENEMA